MVLLLAVTSAVGLTVLVRGGDNSDGASSGAVPIGAGGYVTGLSFSDDGRTRLIKTDTFGGYRWSHGAWTSVTSASALPSSAVHPGLGQGVQAIAVAPGDASVAYMAYDDKIFRSEDGARNWSVVREGVHTSPGDDFRTSGPRIAVDPDNSDVAYYATQLDGLLTTADGGTTWSRAGSGLPPAVEVSASPETGRTPTTTKNPDAPVATGGVTAVAVSRSSPTVRDNRHRTVFAAVWGRGVFRSDDGGSTWSKISPAPVQSVRSLVATVDGELLVTAQTSLDKGQRTGEVWRMSGDTWTQITPPQAADWSSIASDPHDPGVTAVIASGGQIATSSDGGESWQLPQRRQSSRGDVSWLAWSLKGTDYMSVGDLQFDPLKPGRLWFAEGTGVWYSDQRASSTHVYWRSRSRGIEQLVPSDVIDPPGGRPIMVAWDRPLFRSQDLHSYPHRYGPQDKFSSGWSADWSGADPSYLVASVASHQYPSDPHDSSFSTDGGRSWRSFPTVPLSSTDANTVFGYGSMAVGSPGHVVWAPAFGKPPYVTENGGKTWDPVQLPGLSDYSLVDRQAYYINRRILASDKVSPGVFYLYVQDTGTYRSTDEGRHWRRVSDNAAFTGVDMSYDVSMKASPGRAGELFMTPGQLTGDIKTPFYRTTDGGARWARVSGLTGVSAFGFGKALDGSDSATIYAAGHLRGRYGIYYSSNDGSTWRRAITGYPAGVTAKVVAIDGDKDEAGLAYLAMAGAGWTYVRIDAD